MSKQLKKGMGPASIGILMGMSIGMWLVLLTVLMKIILFGK